MKSYQPSETNVYQKANELPGYHGEGYPSGYGGAPPSVSHAEAGYAGYSLHAVAHQSIVQAPQPLSNPHSSYLAWSILNTVCFFLCLGVVARFLKSW
ncbi:hypothetical protein EB796_004583 [Bugula neritina]|uniref:Uncharacterized protein n=1 Tax=Bugula neritina TaxID=10212 RepID=A0A7J7KEP5_BUGNE|nr:hypothetical protein EB796_004583 [Bugula neritina]